MLSLQLHLDDLERRPAIDDGTVRIGKGWVSSFRSRHVTMSAASQAVGHSIWVGSGRDPGPEAVSQARACELYRAFAGHEGFKLFLDGGAAPAIRLIRTMAGTCPLYVAHEGGALTASWKFEDAVAALASPVPDIEACRLFLEHGQTYVRNMVIEGVSMLWPGESLEFDRQGLRFREMDTPDIVLSGALSENARATEEFLRLIGAAVEKDLASSENALIELSGGLDSTCVAVAACAVAEGLNAYGLIHEGAIGKQQIARRRELVELLGVRDFTAPSYAHSPFEALFTEECSYTPYDDLYRLACVSAVDAHPAGAFDLVITGIGGDELTKENTFLRRGEWELPGSICTSSIVHAIGRADMFMRRGILVSHPLVNQQVVDFCRALPKSMREKRALNVLALARAGLSDGFLFPRYVEHYGNVFDRSGALFDFDAPMYESVIADYGISDVSRLLERAREATLHGLPRELLTELYGLLKLEVVLRRYVA
jgi:hypothetical protein